MGSLLLCGCPSYVSRNIISCVVDTIEGMTRRRSGTDMKEECGKVSTPRGVYCNVASSPICISAIVEIVTTASHVYPRLVFWRAIHAVLAIFGLPGRFQIQATTRACHSVFQQAATTGRGKCAAGTHAIPAVFAIFAYSRQLDNSQASDSLSGKIYEVLSHAHSIARERYTGSPVWRGLCNPEMS